MGTERIGWIGLGKLGLTCATTLSVHAGVEVIGYDPDPRVGKILAGDIPPLNNEQGLVDLLTRHRITQADDIRGVVAGVTGLRGDPDGGTGLIFLSVQTPHGPQYGGENPMPNSRADFDYSYLVAACRAASDAADDLGVDITLVIISTCLPGTIRRLVLPVLSERVRVIYNPFFIAMGTTVQDFLHPEFLLLGTDGHRPADVNPLLQLYGRMHPAGQRNYWVHLMSIESAELTKVAYNTFISLKIVFANTLMEICDGIAGADVDEVTQALQTGTDRIVSGRYLTAGMGDGGACHPRDNIAMSYLARNMGLRVDPFEFVTRAREQQSEYLAMLIDFHHSLHPQLPIMLLGKSYKPESDLVYGSPALLLASQLERFGLAYGHWDHHVDDGGLPPAMTLLGMQPAIWVICTKHPEYAEADMPFPPGSVILDPFRYINPDDHPGCTVIGIGSDRGRGGLGYDER